MTTQRNTPVQGDPQRRRWPAHGLRRKNSRRLTHVLTALALTAVAAVLAPTAASAHPATQHRTLSNDCVLGTHTQTFYSYDQWSKGDARLCASLLGRADGTYTLQATFIGDFYYYWGAAWYSEDKCIFGCHLSGAFYLQRPSGPEDIGPIGTTLQGRHGTATYTFEGLTSGHYRLRAGVTKEGGYWRNQGQADSSRIGINTLKIDFDIP
ncbi:hypothetical protein [Nonomuraea diastatica]|uniref:Uncharacterized protein n=1 Tax=Nonomuraea diastatica TaxID=1848329 RepID=A0A4R4WP87_9ACTN|nr:hypothetical protein [Nonomuraea diastatica]TDD18045.1 hypothetical protein E1294_25925 [Nonomuraea diastatica]